LETLEQVYARESVLLGDYPPQVSAPLQVLKIGELRVSAIPAEVFVEIGLELESAKFLQLMREHIERVSTGQSPQAADRLRERRHGNGQADDTRGNSGKPRTAAAIAHVNSSRAYVC
jgi:hypothetical protein